MPLALIGPLVLATAADYSAINSDGRPTYEGYALKADGSGALTLCTAKLDLPSATLYGAVSSSKAEVVPTGSPQVHKVKLAGTVNAGDYLEHNTSGKWIKNNGSTDRVLSKIALEDGVADELIDAINVGPIVIDVA